VTDAKDLPSFLAPDISLILLDLMMPEMDGIEVLRLLGQQQCETSIVLMSGIGERVMESAEKMAHALGLRIAGHLHKPFRLGELEAVLKGDPPHRVPEPVRHDVQEVIPDRELINAVERNEFVLHYQPQIDIVTGAVTGLESLARWQHPKRGLISPDCFVDRIESLDLVQEFNWLIFERALSEVGRLDSRPGVPLRLAWNASVLSLKNLKFADECMRLAKKYSVPAWIVTVEITETGLIEEMARTLDVLTRLRMKGFQLSVDDFGTGYASLKQLRDIPANELKIDRSFVQSMLVSSSDRIMVEKTIEIGHELGMTVLAEGVEKSEQLEFLRQRGCDHAQGYLFSRPMPPAELPSWLETAQRKLGQTRKTPKHLH
jgi:EAL domain-containing protein (putative c-di-GMP-specific phosphodiesterase class I)